MTKSFRVHMQTVMRRSSMELTRSRSQSGSRPPSLLGSRPPSRAASEADVPLLVKAQVDSSAVESTNDLLVDPFAEPPPMSTASLNVIPSEESSVSFPTPVAFIEISEDSHPKTATSEGDIMQSEMLNRGRSLSRTSGRRKWRRPETIQRLHSRVPASPNEVQSPSFEAAPGTIMMPQPVPRQGLFLSLVSSSETSRQGQDVPNIKYLLPTFDSTSANPPHNALQSTPVLSQLGWVQYDLPDRSFYFVHPAQHVTTDIDLRNIKNLALVTKYVSSWSRSSYGTMNDGWELWLREIRRKHQNGRGENVHLESWIHHGRSIVTLNSPYRRKSVTHDDELEMNIRYWSFVETHPAHIVLPAAAQNEATEALTWSNADRLPSNASARALIFSRDEIRDLTNFLESFSYPHGVEEGMRVAISTRLKARVLLRVAERRYALLHPDKPLPQVAPVNRSQEFSQSVLGVLVSCLLMGIPSLLVNRVSHQRSETGEGFRECRRESIADFCTRFGLLCVIMLGTYTAFLFVPGLNDLARRAVLVSILCLIISMTTSVVAILEYQVGARSWIRAPTDGDDVRRSVILSLPLAFLMYSILAFFTGITIYSIA